jgi:hypothetical protein
LALFVILELDRSLALKWFRIVHPPEGHVIFITREKDVTKKAEVWKRLCD